jgi:hypothetical protein
MTWQQMNLAVVFDFPPKNKTYHLFAEEPKSLQRSHGLRARLNVSVDNMRLSTHALALRSNSVGDYIQYRSIRRE